MRSRTLAESSPMPLGVVLMGLLIFCARLAEGKTLVADSCVLGGVWPWPKSTLAGKPGRFFMPNGGLQEPHPMG